MEKYFCLFVKNYYGGYDFNLLPIIMCAGIAVIFLAVALLWHSLA